MNDNNKPASFVSKFEKEVRNGLTDYPKHLPSMYIYDATGDKLFQEIMAMPEYYLTDCEYEILQTHKASLAEAFSGKSGFDLIELGAGDGKKTKIILKYLAEHNYAFDYLPIDISQHILEDLEASLKEEIPEVRIKTQQGTYFQVLKELSKYSERKKVILVLGSNIGNLRHPKAIAFLRNIREAMRDEDLLFMGFDQKKDPQTIFRAYNDAQGITEKFNKNLLHRINRELRADFDVDHFSHWETYDPETGTAKSYLISRIPQEIYIKKLGLKVSFDKWESLHIEISQKYTDKVVDWLAGEAGLQIEHVFADQQNYYKNYVFSKKKV